jgi:hypothetical protein
VVGLQQQPVTWGHFQFRPVMQGSGHAGVSPHY